MPGIARAAELEGPQSVTDHDRDLVMGELSPQFVYPETTRWRFTGSRAYVGNGKIICGTVDIQNGARKYRGVQRFFALIRRNKVVQFGFENDTQRDTLGAVLEMLNEVCPAPG